MPPKIIRRDIEAVITGLTRNRVPDLPVLTSECSVKSRVSIINIFDVFNFLPYFLPFWQDFCMGDGRR